MRSRRTGQVVCALGWVAVVGLAGSAASVSIGASLLSNARASGVAAPLEDEADAEFADDAPVAAPRARLKAPVEFARNPFCPTCSSSVPAGPVPPPDPGGTGPTFGGARQTQLPITLTATLESSATASSLAVVHDNERGIRGPYSIGDELRPGVRLASIGPGSILLSNNGVAEYALVDDVPPPKEVKAPTDKPSSKSKSSLPQADESIACNGNTCTVQRQFVNELLRDPTVLVGQGNVRPTTTADGRSGFRISGARKGTLPRMLGLRSGDVLVEVGGEDATIDKLLALRAKFSRIDELELTVLRRNKPVGLTVVFEG